MKYFINNLCKYYICIINIFISIKLISFILNETLFVDYYEQVNGTVNNISQKHNSITLKKLQKVSLEKDELFQTAKVNAQEAR